MSDEESKGGIVEQDKAAVAAEGGLKRAGLGLGGLATLILLKAKWVLLLVGKFGSALKILLSGKFLLTALSMLGMIVVYAQRSGPAFAVGFVVMILIHELGHAAAIKHAGLKAGWPVFIPFFGALISLKELPRTRAEDAFIALAGPIAGLSVSLFAALVYLTSHSMLWLALAWSGFSLNLFNMIPAGNLDGGRVARAFSKRAAWVGLAVMVGLMVLSPSFQLMLIIAMILPRLFGSDDELPDLTREQQLAWGIRYAVVLAFLAAGQWLAQTLLQQHPLG